ncbi:sugar kinase [Pandoraea terrae]|uniref:Sugar kinase n=1 Tax=Pandoraea terrae TaxID=1537710 RepID=A0A5E4XG84_9BURK|nr:sugar kinase [Pandoraea terrae]
MTSLPRLVICGEALTDFIREDGQSWRALAGGSCWNVARVGARLGVPTGFAGAVSHDVFGAEIMARSTAAGLDLRFLQQVDRPPLLAMIASQHPPQYFFIGENSADLAFDAGRLPSGWLDAVDIVHFGSISLARQPLAEHLLHVAEAVHAAGKRIAFDPNYRSLMSDAAYQPTLRRMAALATYIKVSDEDLRGLFPGLGENAALAQLRAWAPEASVLLTRGVDGMQLLTPHGEYFQPAYAVPVRDTVGCGDAAMGGWLARMLSGQASDPAGCLVFAAACAAIACCHRGPYAPSEAEVSDFLRQQGAGVPSAVERLTDAANS